MTRTYYEIVGVSSTATTDEIRTAYITLMKEHHPDVAGGGAESGAGETVALLNRCYAVLRDPRKRSEYDAGLIANSPSEGEDPALVRHALVVPPPQFPQRHWGIPLLVVAAAAIILVAQIGWQSFDDDGYAASSLLSWAEKPAPPKPPRPLLAIDVSRQARLATEVSTDEALTFSRRCFDEARARLDLTSVRLCIVFDDALLYWRQNASDYNTLPLYFSDEATRMRHLDALEEAGKNAEKQLGDLRDLTFKALLAQLTQHHDDQVDAVSPAPANDAHQARTLGNSNSQNETGTDKKS
jgi:DnaJ domain